jgi:RNase P/RNase MRP subunit p30
MFYDFWIENFDDETKKLLKRFGFSGACLFGTQNVSDSFIMLGKSIKNKSNETTFPKAPEVPSAADFLVLWNNDEKVQRAAIKSNSVDGIRAFVKYPAVKEMAEKRIALVICFSDLLNAYDQKKMLFLMRRSVGLAKKYKTPIVIASGAKDNSELRAVSELVALGEVLGLNAGDAKKALGWFQEKLLERAKLKREGRYISLGVTVINEAKQ